MGNTIETGIETDTEVLKIYSQLINMGFNEQISLKAASKYPKNVNKAINHILSGEKTSNKNITEQKTQTAHRSKYCDSVEKCPSLKRTIKCLTIYQHQNDVDSELSNYLSDYGYNLLDDYHHILEYHLNEDYTSTYVSDKHFELIYKQIQQNNLLCNISKCQIYLRNNRNTA
eukprot:420002_1